MIGQGDSDMDAAQEKLASDLKTLIGDAEALLRATADQAGERVTAVRERIERSLGDSKQSLGEVEEYLLSRGKEAAKSADAYVKEHPWTALGFAAGAGLVLGLLIRRD
jgi:ElaB/YqjD/DUF883 family membrane-anchored ribosome-binding protein